MFSSHNYIPLRYFHCKILEHRTSLLHFGKLFPWQQTVKNILYTSTLNCLIKKLSLCHVRIKLITISRLTSLLSGRRFQGNYTSQFRTSPLADSTDWNNCSPLNKKPYVGSVEFNMSIMGVPRDVKEIATRAGWHIFLRIFDTSIILQW